MNFSRRSNLGLSLALGCLALLLGASTAVAAPAFEITGHHLPTRFKVGDDNAYVFFITNVGDEATNSEPVTVEVELPPGVTTRMDDPYFPEPIDPAPLGGAAVYRDIDAWGDRCGDGPDIFTPGQSSVKCTMPLANYPFAFGDTALGPGNVKRMHVYVSVAPGFSGPLTATATVSGGGGQTAVGTETAVVGPDPEFGTVSGSPEADGFDSTGAPQRQAGAHPFRASGRFDMNLETIPTTDFSGAPRLGTRPADGALRTVRVTTPRGFTGNPTAVPRCAQYALCSEENQVGTIDLGLQALVSLRNNPPAWYHLPVYNLVPDKGQLAEFQFRVEGRVIRINVSLDPFDHSVIVEVGPIDETLAVHHQRLTLWGVPSDPSHDRDRLDPAQGWGASSNVPRRPFLTMPTECNVEDTTLFQVESWNSPGIYEADRSAPAAVSGCSQLDFSPTIVSRPTTNLADSPAGLEFDLHIPQSEDPDGLGTAHLRDAVVTLPAGMTVNPPSADGLSSCSPAQVGLTTPVGQPDAHFNGAPAACPDASRIGRVELLTPAIDHPVTGHVFLADQNQNPFGSLLALYIAIYDPETGLVVKIPGEVKADSQTGQLTAIVKNNPQLPFEDLRLEFFGGSRASLKTPSACGVYSTASTLTPWSAPEAASATPGSSFELVGGPSGGACLGAGSGAPNSPGFNAGTVDPTAKAFTPFTLKLTRADGTQQLQAIDTTLPKGLLGKLAGTTYCSDAALSSAAGKSGKDERASASCPTSSRVGTVTVGSGAGSTPLYVNGTAYLAGPYKGAPLSLAIITPAVAGPFDLGTVVVRTKLDVNPENAQIHAVSDELPTILQGIPLNIRSVALKMDRPDFTLNPTSCDPMKVEGSALSVFGQSAGLSSPFQVGECNKLGFKPDLKLKLKGGTKRSDFPALTATVTARPGDANIGKTVVALPRSEFLAQSHIRTICTRVQYAADTCPEGSIYGKATAWSPLLDQPLSGNVYLRSSPNPLPDMVVALEGQIDVDLVGRIDSFKKGIRTTFDTVPDAPVSKFVLEMQGGKKGLLENSRNLCKTVNKATVEMSGQNGATYDSTPVLQSKCKKPKAKKKSGAKKHGKKG